MLQLEMERPWLLAGMVLLVLLFIVIWRFGGRNNRKVSIRSLIFHILAGTLLLLAMAGTSIRWQNNEVVTVYVADLSDSIKSEKAAMEEFITAAIQDMPATETAGIIAFGGDVALEQFVTDKKVFQKFNVEPLASATNLEEALSAAMALYREDAAKRLVLLTDGYENAGSAVNLVSSILGNQVDVKVVKMESEEVGEAYVNKLEIPEKINIGERFPVKVRIISNVSTNATVTLYLGRTFKAQEQVSLSPGENSFVFWDVQNSGGFQTYRVVIEPEVDAESVNNEMAAYTTIEAPPKILLVEGEAGKAASFQAILEAAAVDYKLVTTQGTPENITQMLEYRSIILLDVHADDLKTGFMNSLESYVKDYAGGLIAIGGENSFALGNYQDTPLETALPVYMDLKGEKEIPSIAFVMVIDQSGSMSDGNGNVTNLDLAKEAAIAALDNLRAKDYIGVISFSDSYTWVTKLTAADDPDKVKSQIAGIPLGGGTSIYPALAEAVKALSAHEATLKHVLLLTDGQDTQRDYADVIQEMEENGITLSTVSVGTGADTNLLTSLAEDGGGRYYHTDSNTNLPRIFAQEVFLSVRSYLVNREFTPLIAADSEIASPLSDGMPSMYGYVAATKKEMATGLLVSDDNDPILTVWQYGLGKTVAFNSDGENKWTGNYAGWDPYVQLWKNLIDYTVTETSAEGKSLTVENSDGRTQIRYETDEWTADTLVTAVTEDEEGITREIELYPESPGVFVGETSVTEPGVYSVNVKQHAGEEIIYHQNAAYVLPYSQEYQFADNPDFLESFTAMVGGTMIDEPADVFAGDIVNSKTRVSLMFPLLMIALAIFMADVIMRRVMMRANLLPRLKEGYEKRKEAAAGTAAGTIASNKEIQETHQNKRKDESAYDATLELLRRKQEREE